MKKKFTSSKSKRFTSSLSRGFTLVEIMIVCAIIAMLSVLVVINLQKAQAKSRDTQRKADLSAIATALENYKVDNKTYVEGAGHFVPASTGLVLLIDDDPDISVLGRNYIFAIPTDPLNDPDNDYEYRYMADMHGNQYKITAKSETIAVPSGQNTCDVQAVIDDAKVKAGDFYNPITGYPFCNYFQVSSSYDAMKTYY